MDQLELIAEETVETSEARRRRNHRADGRSSWPKSAAVLPTSDLICRTHQTISCGAKP